MTLVDTSVWISHLRQGDHQLTELLNEGTVLCHPFVIGELACGNLRNRDEVLNLLSVLPSAPTANHDEVLFMIEDRVLSGRGLGWIDVHLLAAALLANCRLWTHDRSLVAAATEMRLS